MKRNLWIKASSIALLLTMSGCFTEKAPEEQNEPAQVVVDPRAALVNALDGQATQLVNGINKVIITGNFIKNMNLQNPPEAIPLNNDNEVKKAINYILSNQNTQGGVTTYRPDSRVCSEIMAKNHPTSCIETMKEITLAQTPADDTHGILVISLANAQPFTLSYGPEAVSITSEVGELVKALAEISRIKELNGEDSFAATLPLVHQGVLQASVSSQLSISTVSVSILQALDIQGKNENGKDYALQALASQNMISVYLDSVFGLAHASIALPQASVSFDAQDNQNVSHQVDIYFPGLSGSLTLDNSLSKISSQALMLVAPDVYINVDGQNAIHGIFADDLNAEIKMSAGGNGSIKVLQSFSAQGIFSANALIDSVGTITASIAQDTEVSVPSAAKQAKVLSGSLQLFGTGDFSANMDAQAGTCFDGDKNAPIFLQSVVCQ